MKNVAPVVTYRVNIGDHTAGRHGIPVDEMPAHQPEAVTTSHASAHRIDDRYGPSAWLTSVSDFLAGLPRPIAIALMVSAFLILINIFTGL